MKTRKLSETELALRLIIAVMAPEIAYFPSPIIHNRKDKFHNFGGILGEKGYEPKKGDVAIALTAGYINCNPFTIAIVDHKIEGGLCVKDIKTGRLCDFTNEQFLVIPKDEMGYKWKFGLERKVYELLEEEWSGSWYKMQLFSLQDGHLLWTVRETFKNEIFAKVEFDLNGEQDPRAIAIKATSMMDEEIDKAEKRK